MWYLKGSERHIVKSKADLIYVCRQRNDVAFCVRSSHAQMVCLCVCMWLRCGICALQMFHYMYVRVHTCMYTIFGVCVHGPWPDAGGTRSTQGCTLKFVCKRLKHDVFSISKYKDQNKSPAVRRFARASVLRSFVNVRVARVGVCVRECVQRSTHFRDVCASLSIRVRTHRHTCVQQTACEMRLLLLLLEETA